MYLAEQARFMDHPEHVFDNEVDESHTLVLCRAFVGVAHDYGQATVLVGDMPMTRVRRGQEWHQIQACCVKGGPHRPTKRGAGGQLDSVLYVLCKSHQLYPEYLVTYRKDH